MSRPAGGEWQRLHLLTWSGFQSSQLLEFSGRSGSGHLLVLRTLCPAQRGPAKWTKVGAEIHLAVGPAAEWLEEPGVREPHSNSCVQISTSFSNHPCQGGAFFILCEGAMHTSGEQLREQNAFPSTLSGLLLEATGPPVDLRTPLRTSQWWEGNRLWALTSLATSVVLDERLGVQHGYIPHRHDQ